MTEVTFCRCCPVYQAAGRQWYSSTQRFLSRRPSSSRKKHRCLIVSRSSSSSDEAEEQKVAPLVPQSPAGLFLSQILGSYPHLFPAAAEQQLEMLVAERDQQEEEGNTSELQSSDNLILYRYYFHCFRLSSSLSIRTTFFCFGLPPSTYIRCC